ncbi:MAG: copper resistance protein CopC, partial [Actinomycetota bacterium]|nr:copper resistance protein CopC [Actinomycetota bacterium]
MPSARVRRPLLLAVVALTLGWVPPAFGHASFLGAQPQPGTRMETAPAEVALSFTEPLNERLSRATLVAGDGKEVPVEVQASAQRLVLRAAGVLGTGAYRVRWHTVSTEDGHALEGTFSFGVRAAAAGNEHLVQQSPLARHGWIRVLLRALFYVAALLFVGALVLRTFLSRRGSWLVPTKTQTLDVAAVALRERQVIVNAGWAAAGLAAAVTLAEAADAAAGLSLTGTRDFLAGSVAGAGRTATVVLLA